MGFMPVRERGELLEFMLPKILSYNFWTIQASHLSQVGAAYFQSIWKGGLKFLTE